MATVTLSCPSLFGAARSVKLSSSFCAKNTQSRRLSLAIRVASFKHILNLSSRFKNERPKRFLNVEYAGYETQIDITLAENLDEVLLAIKAVFPKVLAQVDAPELQLLDQQGKQIADVDTIPEDYYKKPENGGLFIGISTTPPFSRQPTQTDLVSKFSGSFQYTRQLVSKLTPASPELSAFWNAFKGCSDPIEANSVIKLPENVSILGDDSIGSSIFIRPCYPKLLDIALSLVESKGKWRLIILGTPGIGKTFFGCLLLLHLARIEATVVYESRLSRSRYLFSPTKGVFKGRIDDFGEILEDSSTFYIVDGVAPEVVLAKTILLTSFRKEIWNQFSKHSTNLRYMPVWSKEEILTCRSLLYRDISQLKVESLYEKWGGIPRYVFQYAFDVYHQGLLKEALDISNIDSVVESFGKYGEKVEVSSRVLHQSVDGDFQSGHFVFASDYVAEEVFTHVYAKNRAHLLEFISAAERVSKTSQLQCVMFEKYAHAIISRGGKFRIRQLYDSSEMKDQENMVTEENKTLDVSTELTTFLYTLNDSEFKLAEDRYFRPKSKNFESVDAFIKPNILFEMSVAEKHPIKLNELQKISDILVKPSTLQLYFVVLPNQFYSFKYQPYLKGNCHVDINQIAQVSQFVLTFDFSSQ